MRTLPYFSQRGKNAFGYSGTRKCFTACAWMLLCHYDPSRYSVTDVADFDKYFDDVEKTVGERGIGEEVFEREHRHGGASSIYFDVQKAGLEKYLGMPAHVNVNYPLSDLPSLVQARPVIIRTYRLGNILPGGHMIVLVDYDSLRGEYIVNDPYGNAVGLYQSADGAGVRYNSDWLRPFIDNGRGGGIILYV